MIYTTHILNILDRFGVDHECDRQKDRQTVYSKRALKTTCHPDIHVVPAHVTTHVNVSVKQSWRVSNIGYAVVFYRSIVCFVGDRQSYRRSTVT